MHEHLECIVWGEKAVRVSTFKVVGVRRLIWALMEARNSIRGVGLERFSIMSLGGGVRDHVSSRAGRSLSLSPGRPLKLAVSPV